MLSASAVSATIAMAMVIVAIAARVVLVVVGEEAVMGVVMMAAAHHSMQTMFKVGANHVQNRMNSVADNHTKYPQQHECADVGPGVEQIGTYSVLHRPTQH